MKHRNNIRALALLTLGIWAIVSCGKYEEGAKFSLRTKKARIANTWIFESGTVTKFDEVETMPDSLFATFSLVMEKNGTYQSKQDSTAIDVGGWEFCGDVGVVLTSTEDNGPSTLYDILKLKHDSWWIRNTEGEGEAAVITEVHWKAE